MWIPLVYKASPTILSLTPSVKSFDAHNTNFRRRQRQLRHESGYCTERHSTINGLLLALGGEP
jgi:hypothetical protein